MIFGRNYLLNRKSHKSGIFKGTKYCALKWK